MAHTTLLLADNTHKITNSDFNPEHTDLSSDRLNLSPDRSVPSLWDDLGFLDVKKKTKNINNKTKKNQYIISKLEQFFLIETLPYTQVKTIKTDPNTPKGTNNYTKILVHKW